MANDTHTAPSVRSAAEYPFVPGALTGLLPRPGYAGAIALVPTSPGAYRVALCVTSKADGGAAWLPPRGAVIVDVPAGFPVADGDAILKVLQAATPGSLPGGPGSVGGDT
jgi:hypothetical protein